MLRKNNPAHYVSYHAEIWYVESIPYQHVFPFDYAHRHRKVSFWACRTFGDTQKHEAKPSGISVGYAQDDVVEKRTNEISMWQGIAYPPAYCPPTQLNRSNSIVGEDTILP